MLTKEQLRQALKKLENVSSKNPPTVSEEVWQKLLSLSPKERAEIALQEAEERGYY